MLQLAHTKVAQPKPGELLASNLGIDFDTPSGTNARLPS